MTRIVHFAAAPLLYSKLFKLLYQVPEGIFMRRIPVSKGLGIGEETVIQCQKECRQILRCNSANLCAYDTLTDGITAASVDVERFFHGSDCFLPDPRNPSMASCWTVQLDGQPEKWHLGKRVVSLPLSRSTVAIRTNVP